MKFVGVVQIYIPYNVWFWFIYLQKWLFYRCCTENQVKCSRQQLSVVFATFVHYLASTQGWSLCPYTVTDRYIWMGSGRQMTYCINSLLTQSFPTINIMLLPSMHIATNSTGRNNSIVWTFSINLIKSTGWKVYKCISILTQYRLGFFIKINKHTSMVTWNVLVTDFKYPFSPTWSHHFWNESQPAGID